MTAEPPENCVMDRDEAAAGRGGAPAGGEARVRRRLATVLAADVADYSALVARNEEATIRALKDARKVFDGRIEEYNGRIANTAGDSVIAVFSSPVSAVRCASEVQEALSLASQRRGEGARVRFRIGVHLGDVLLDGKDVLGDAVNMAARLESVATPGAVSISTVIKEQIGTRFASYPMADLGERHLKNMPHPVRVYELLSPRGSAQAAGGSASEKRLRFIILLICALFIMSGTAGLGIMAAKSLLFTARSQSAFEKN